MKSKLLSIFSNYGRNNCICIVSKTTAMRHVLKATKLIFSKPMLLSKQKVTSLTYRSTHSICFSISCLGSVYYMTVSLKSTLTFFNVSHLQTKICRFGRWECTGASRPKGNRPAASGHVHGRLVESMSQIYYKLPGHSARVDRSRQ